MYPAARRTAALRRRAPPCSRRHSQGHRHSPGPRRHSRRLHKKLIQKSWEKRFGIYGKILKQIILLSKKDIKNFNQFLFLISIQSI